MSASASGDRQGLDVLHQELASVVLNGDEVIEVHRWLNSHD